MIRGWFTSRIRLELSTAPRIRLGSMPYVTLSDVIFFSLNLATVSASNPSNASLQIANSIPQRNELKCRVFMRRNNYSNPGNAIRVEGSTNRKICRFFKTELQSDPTWAPVNTRSSNRSLRIITQNNVPLISTVLDMDMETELRGVTEKSTGDPRTYHHEQELPILHHGKRQIWDLREKIVDSRVSWHFVSLDCREECKFNGGDCVPELAVTKVHRFSSRLEVAAVEGDGLMGTTLLSNFADLTLP